MKIELSTFYLKPIFSSLYFFFFLEFLFYRSYLTTRPVRKSVSFIFRHDSFYFLRNIFSNVFKFSMRLNK